ncbi:ComF family protein [Inhella sp.]|uniref:ComF family protein n=1 Tax=Inhella sp. TaxID=1921806 RepID=UPI0035B45535
MRNWLNPAQWPLPGGCWICRDWSRERLCGPCVERFAAPRPRCLHCALTLATPACAHCLRDPLPLHSVQAAVDFEPPWDTLLHALKYEAALGLAPALAALMPAPPPGSLLLPVPLHPTRLGERGHNQSTLLARELARRCALPCAERVLERVIDTPTQTQLSRTERMKNLRHAFALAPGHSVQGRHCVLVDDVMTTGATLATLARLLLAHGAVRVDACVVARTPEPDAP